MRRPRVGDIVRVEKEIFGHIVGFEEYKLVEFNFCLGFFGEDGPESPINFTPLSDLIIPSPDATREYFSNYRPYYSDYVNTFVIISTDQVKEQSE